MKDCVVKVKGKINCQKYQLKEGQTEQQLIKEIDSGIAQPYETLESKNTWLTTGWTEILKIITGASTSHFDSTYTLIGVGTDATAASAAQTALLGSSTAFATMSSGYPTTPASGTVQFKARFTTSVANFAHNELVVKNSSSGVCWNRNATGWGTKTTSDIWDYTVTLGTA